MTTSSASRIPTLDGLRAIAIGMVVLSHIIDRHQQIAFAEIGHVGVMLFFALSGYLITSRLLDEYRQNKRISLRDFYVRRAFRILPPAILYLALLALLSSLGLVVCTPESIRSALLFYTNYIDVGQNGWRAGHFWSLSVEEHFYILWPCLLIFFGITTGWRTAAAMIIVICAWRPIDGNYHVMAELFHAPYLQGYEYRTDLIADTLLWGCLLALLPRFKLGTYASTIGAVSAIFLLVLMAIGIHVPGMPRNIYYSIPIMHMLPVIVLAAVVSCPGAPIGKWLETAPMRFVGGLSYSLYIWQQLFLGGPGQQLPILIGIAAALVAAYLSFNFVEKPCIKFGRRISGRQAIDLRPAV